MVSCPNRVHYQRSEQKCSMLMLLGPKFSSVVNGEDTKKKKKNKKKFHFSPENVFGHSYSVPSHLNVTPV